MIGKSLQGLNLLALLTVLGGQVLVAEAARAEQEADVVIASQPEIEQTERAVPETTSAATPEPEPATTVEDWQAQIDASLVQITSIRVENAETGLQVAIEADGELATPSQSVSGNALVLEIPNATLVEQFQEFEPAEGIALVQVSTLPGDIVQVAITGSDAVPVVNIAAEATGLVLGVTPGVAPAGTDDDAIQLVVTGEEDGYVEPNATVGTRTDTPLRDVPQSIQVIPRALLEDQGVTRLDDALRNASGVVSGENEPRGQRFTIRGFGSASVLRDGFRLTNGGTGNIGFLELANVEQIEVLKGPASLLFGEAQPGGVINVVSERPLSEPRYELGLQLGNRGLIQPSLDFSGPLTEDGRLLYRVNALVRREGYYRDFNTDINRFFFAPVISWAISDNTDLILELEYRDEERPNDFGLIADGGSIVSVPFDRALGSRDDVSTNETIRFGYQFEHRFSDNWQIRNAFYHNRYDTTIFTNLADFLLPSSFNSATGDLTIIPGRLTQPTSQSELQTNVVGEFSTGSIDHTLLVGVDFFRRRNLGSELRTLLPPTIIDTLNVFNPNYDVLRTPDYETADLGLADSGQTDSWGIYVQDQIQLLDNLIVLAGLRYDTVSTENDSTLLGTSTVSSQSAFAFSPRLGVVYQPTEEISLYTSYGRSFNPNSVLDAAGNILDPEQGEQFEVGVRAELLGGDFVANLALYDLEKQNVAVADPAVNGRFVTSNQRSRGIELDLIGEILPGWNVVANYAYTDAVISDSPNPAVSPEGNRLFNVPEHNFNFWTNYEIQTGSLEGLGFGVGLNYVGERSGDLLNSYTVDSYVLTNAAISYERDNWRAGLNFRNLFDQDYILSTANGGEIIPGAGFTVVGSFTIEF